MLKSVAPFVGDFRRTLLLVVVEQGGQQNGSNGGLGIELGDLFRRQVGVGGDKVDEEFHLGGKPFAQELRRASRSGFATSAALPLSYHLTMSGTRTRDQPLKRLYVGQIRRGATNSQVSCA